MGSYTIDSHNVQRYITPEGYVQNEGDIGVSTRGPYGIAYGSLVPKKEQCENLFVPVAVSASHIAYGSIRMEPVFMILGQSAATAAALAIDGDSAVQDVAYADLKPLLEKEGQILSYDGPVSGGKGKPISKMAGIVVDDEAATLTGSWTSSEAAESFIGFNYRHDGKAGNGKAQAIFEAEIGDGGEYAVRFGYTPNANRAKNVKVTIGHAGGTDTVVVDETQKPSHGLFHELGVYTFKSGQKATVTVTNEGTEGYVVIDGVQWEAVKWIRPDKGGQVIDSTLLSLPLGICFWRGSCEAESSGAQHPAIDGIRLLFQISTVLIQLALIENAGELAEPILDPLINQGFDSLLDGFRVIPGTVVNPCDFTRIAEIKNIASIRIIAGIKCPWIGVQPTFAIAFRFLVNLAGGIGIEHLIDRIPLLGAKIDRTVECGELRQCGAINLAVPFLGLVLTVEFGLFGCQEFLEHGIKEFGIQNLRHLVKGGVVMVPRDFSHLRSAVIEVFPELLHLPRGEIHRRGELLDSLFIFTTHPLVLLPGEAFIGLLLLRRDFGIAGLVSQQFGSWISRIARRPVRHLERRIGSLGFRRDVGRILSDRLGRGLQDPGKGEARHEPHSQENSRIGFHHIFYWMIISLSFLLTACRLGTRQTLCRHHGV